MRGGFFSLSRAVASLLLLWTLPARVLGDQILKTSGFTDCLTESTITVNHVDIQYDNSNQSVTFSVSGTSTKVQNVTAVLNVTAYGISVYSNTFPPCSPGTFVKELCPVPAGTFSATGTQSIPANYANMVPSIAFTIPDIDAQAHLELLDMDGVDVACINTEVSNGRTTDVAAVSYVAAAVAGAALIGTSITALSALGGTGSGGAGTTSPSFGEIFGVFQGFAMNGMMSVNYPTVYRSFTKNFAFSTGLIQLTAMQNSIDNFRSVTGGNLTNDNVQFLQDATLAFSSNTDTTKRSLFERAIQGALLSRDFISTSASNDTTSASNATTSTSELSVIVSGVQAYAEQLSVPQANTFMTVLIIVAIVVAAIAVGILAFKTILEIWSLFASFPESLTGFRKHYWGTMARSIVNLILILYGTWVLYCIWEFTHGDSWAAKLLAGITLALFTGVLAFFSFKIWRLAQKAKQIDGDTSALYYDKKNWLKYSLFYDSYKKDYWWLFLPAIIYAFAKGCVLVAADGHGLVQTITQLVIETLMLGLLIWNRPYERRSGNVINIFIQIVRALSVVCILIFVEELGISETTTSIAGVVLIVIQGVLTGSLAILICVNAIIMCFKANPHRKRRKEAEKLNRDLDNLTPLDARNSLLLTMKPGSNEHHHRTGSLTSSRTFTKDVKAMSPLMQTNSDERFDDRNTIPLQPYRERDLTPQARGMRHLHTESMENLVDSAAPLDGGNNQQPTLPNVQGYGDGYRRAQY